MRKMGKNQWIKGMLFTLAFTLGIFTWNSDSVVSLAAGNAKVKASSAMIRKDADKSSDVVASVLKGDSLDVISSKKASDGQTWYKVYVDGEKTGYIRSDLVTVDEKVSEEKTEDKKEDTKEEENESGGNKTVVGSNNSTSTEKKEETKTEVKTEVAVVNVSPTDVTTAKSTDDVRVRKGAGTKFDVAGVAKKGTEVTVTGVAADTEGKNWYQASFNDGNKTINGFIREDFLEVLTRAAEEPATEEEPAAEEEPATEETAAENEDYYLKYMQNDSGEMDWYLFDNTEGSSQSLTQLLEAIEKVEDKELEEAKMVSVMRIIIIALGVILIILFAVITILIFKLRDASYEYEEEDDEEEDDEEEDDEEEDDEKPARKSVFGFGKKKTDVEEEEEDEEEEEEEEDDEEDERPARKPLFGFKKKKATEEEEEEEAEEETLKEIQPVSTKKNTKAENNAWHSKDFLELDDDMEFEFLDL